MAIGIVNNMNTLGFGGGISKYPPSYSEVSQLFFNPYQAQAFDLANNEVINAKGDGNNLKLVDSWWWNSNVGDNVTPQTAVSLTSATEISIGVSIYYHTNSPTARIFSFLGIDLRTDGTNKRIQIPAATNVTVAQNTANNSLVVGNYYRIWFTAKVGGKQRIYINGVLSNENDSVLTSYTASGFMYLARWIANIGASFYNLQVWTKELVQSDITYDYNNPYGYLQDNGNVAYTDCYLWHKMADGTGPMYDATDALRNSSTIPSGWLQTNDKWHSNLIHGCLIYSEDYEVTKRYIPFNINKKVTDYYLNVVDPKYYQSCYQDGKTFTKVETKVQQKTLALSDCNNFWYDSGGVALKKSYSDFVANNGNRIYADTSWDYQLNNITTYTSEQASTFINNYFKINKKNSRNFFIYGDSMPGGLSYVLKNLAKKVNAMFIANSYGVGGEHSYVLAEGKWQQGVNTATKLPLDIKTRYPENPNGLWTGYDTQIASPVITWLNSAVPEKQRIHVVWHGTNNPINTYVGTFDYNTEHYRLLPDHLLGKQTNQDNDYNKYIIIGHGNITSDGYDDTMTNYENYANSINAKFINPKTLLRDCYNLLYINSVSHPAIAKLIEYDINNIYIIEVNNNWYVYSANVPKTNTLGQPLKTGDVVASPRDAQITEARWFRLNCNDPAETETIKGVLTRVYNPCLNSASLTGNPFIIDDNTTWPQAFRRDNIHPNSIALALIGGQIITLYDAYKWYSKV